MISPAPRTIRLAAAFVALVATAPMAQLAKDASKYIGNITTNNAVRSGYLTYWNQITPENETKWGIVQSGGRTSFDWRGADNIKNFVRKTAKAATHRG